MTEGLQPELLRAFRNRLAAQTGWRLPDERLPELKAVVQALATQQQSTWACLHGLAATPLTVGQIQLLARHFTIGETSFFRDAGFYATLERVVLPELIARRAARRQLAIWSAGCCTGEEPYSIAILLQQLLADSEEWQLQMAGTDINPAFLQQAQAGQYRAWALRNTPDAMRQAWFTQEGAAYQLAETIRKRVKFSYFNLVDPQGGIPGAGGFDLIVCRNVLMYLDAPGRAQALRCFQAALNDAGWLLVSPIDGTFIQESGLQLVSLEGGAFYQKRGRRTADRAIGRAGSKTAAADRRWQAAAPAIAARLAPEAAGSRREEAAAVVAPAAPAGRAAGRYRLAGRSRNARCRPGSLPAPAMLRLAHWHANRQAWQRALFWCRQRLAADTQDVSARYLAALVHAEMGQAALADQELQRVIYLDSTFVLAYLARASLALKRQQMQAARQAMQAAARLLEQRPDMDAPLKAAGMTFAQVEALAGTLMQRINTERERFHA